jgi:hypothetical protein
MGALTEPEILDCLVENLRLAAECAETLATSPRKGPPYDRLRQHLHLVEGACRQASVWREDTRWLILGKLMAECHQKAGGWLRGFKDESGARVSFAEGVRNPLFLMLANNLRAAQKGAEDLKGKATGRRGMILPDVLPGPHRDTRPTGWTRNGSIIVPGVAA